MQSDIHLFRNLLIQATRNIDDIYFQLPIATWEHSDIVSVFTVMSYIINYVRIGLSHSGTL